MFTAPTASAHTVPLAKLDVIKYDPSCILLALHSGALRRGPFRDFHPIPNPLAFEH